AECVPDGGLRCRRVKVARVAGTQIELWNVDDGGDGSSRVMIRTPAGWLSGWELGFEIRAANMAEFPHDGRRLREEVRAGTLADGTPALVQRMDTRDRFVRRCAGKP